MVQQPLQLHAQPAGQGGRCRFRRIPHLPGPGPCRDGFTDLLQGLNAKIHTQTGAIARCTNHSGGVIADAAGMQKLQTPCGQIALTAMGIDQLTGDQIQSHGIDREVTPHQIRRQGPRLHHRVLCWRRIVLLSGRGQIKRHTIEIQGHRGELVMVLNTGHPRGPATLQQHL